MYIFIQYIVYKTNVLVTSVMWSDAIKEKPRQRSGSEDVCGSLLTFLFIPWFPFMVELNNCNSKHRLVGWSVLHGVYGVWRLQGRTEASQRR